MAYDGTYTDTAGTNYININHTGRYVPFSAWSDYALYGLGGNDILIGGHGDDYLSGSTGNDTLRGGYGVNILSGGTGIDTADYATFGTNTTYVSSYGIYANLASGVAYARSANQNLDDTLYSIENLNGSNYADRIYGNSIDNVLKGNGGNDAIYGAAGADDIYGGNGADWLNGQTGDDYVDGGAGNDEIWGGANADYLVGGTGYDVFNFAALSDSTNTARDFISDFEIDVDLLDLSALNAFEFIGTESFAANGYADGLVRYYWSGGNTVVQLDANGGGVADLVFTLRGNIDLIASDFVF
jgi:serralysin